MSAAIGGSPAPTRPGHGELWVDVRDFGAVADGLTDNTAAFQAAIDAVAARIDNTNLKGVVFVPSSDKGYGVNNSIWLDQPNIELRGEGWGSHIAMHGNHSLIITGVRRTEYKYPNGVKTPVQITAPYRPDLFGKLDSSAVPIAGQRWGLRTNGDSWAQFQANSMSNGQLSSVGQFHYDSWAETTKLTLEFCIEPPDGQLFPVGAPLLGSGFNPYEPSPFVVGIWDDPNKVLVQFRTADIGPGRFLPGRSFAFLLTGATAPYRVVLQFDLDNAACTAFVNGIQVPFVYQNNLAPTGALPFTPGTGQRFQANDTYPFMIGAHDYAGPFNTPSGVDLRVYGLRMSNSIRYQNRGPGQPQRRADSPASPINDAYAYFGMDANTICYLAGTDNPATAGRVVSVVQGNQASIPGVASGVFMSAVNTGGIPGNAVRDLFLASGNGCGQTIAVGGVLEFTVENVKALGGFNAVGSFVMFANYLIYVRNCWLDAYDSPFFGAYAVVIARDIFFARSGRVAIRLLGGDSNWENALVASAEANSECIIKITNGAYGGNFHFANVFVDYEGYVLTLAAIYCESISYAPATSLILRDVFFGSVGSKVSLIMLKDLGVENINTHKCWLSVDNMQAYTTDYAASVDVDGELWHGEVRGVALNGPRFKHRGTYGTKANVVIREVAFTAPPRLYPWYRGAHVLEVRSPADGQFTEWRCLNSGAYGTPTPPGWVGLSPVSYAPNAVAAYVLNHAYMTAALS